jgi:uncharacterized Zn finger protein
MAIEKVISQNCPKCGGALSAPMFCDNPVKECQNCGQIWSEEELFGDIEYSTSEPDTPPASNFL